MYLCFNHLHPGMLLLLQISLHAAAVQMAAWSWAEMSWFSPACRRSCHWKTHNGIPEWQCLPECCRYLCERDKYRCWRRKRDHSKGDEQYWCWSSWPGTEAALGKMPLSMSNEGNPKTSGGGMLMCFWRRKIARWTWGQCTCKSSWAERNSEAEPDEGMWDQIGTFVLWAPNSPYLHPEHLKQGAFGSCHFTLSICVGCFRQSTRNPSKKIKKEQEKRE